VVVGVTVTLVVGVIVGVGVIGTSITFIVPPIEI
jgi:hypothetical protein